MIIPEHEIRESAIEGRGVFLKSNVKKGELLVIYTYGISELIHKEYHDQVCRDLENSPHRDVVDSSVRYVDNWFIFDAYSKHNLCFGSREGDFVNHSFEPAMIYHCGLCFAARDLKAGDELTELHDLAKIAHVGRVAAHRLEAVLESRVEPAEAELPFRCVVRQRGDAEDVEPGQFVDEVRDVGDVRGRRAPLDAGDRVDDVRRR